jgi:hypothetical protein
MILYDFDEIFKINENCKINFYDLDWGSYVYVENFWEHPEKIAELFFNSPCIIIPSICYNNFNGEKYFDGRNHFCFPYKPYFMDFCVYLIQKYFCFENVKIKWDKPHTLFGNIFQMIDNEFNDYKSYHYAPHTDGSHQYACTWYMNSDYMEEDGTAFYNKSVSSIRDYRLNKIKTPWTNNVEKIGLIPAQFNCMSIYDGSIPHGQSLSSNWFKNKRLSLVQFFEVFNNVNRY